MEQNRRLIDADALTDAIYAITAKTGLDRLYIDDVIDAIDDMDWADAVEVIRCKDCKHRYNGKDCSHPLLLSYSWGAIRHVKDNDFCSYGERRT